MRDDEPRILRREDGTFVLKLTRAERSLLRTLPGQLRKLVDEEDPSTRRLFPPAYRDDPEREAEYRRMVHRELVEGRRRALEVVEATTDARSLDQEQLAAWLGVLNDLRLVLGTRLDVTEDTSEEDFPPDDPRRAELVLYHYLGWLEAQAVDALAGA
jgi:Domain of unknown function (DUF2017)